LLYGSKLEWFLSVGGAFHHKHTGVLGENLIRSAAVDFLAFGRGLWDHSSGVQRGRELKGSTTSRDSWENVSGPKLLLHVIR
jgi:hypothetical protein